MDLRKWIGIAGFVIGMLLLGALSRAADPGSTSGTLTPMLRTKAEALKTAKSGALSQFEAAPGDVVFAVNSSSCPMITCTGDHYCVNYPGTHPSCIVPIRPIGIVYRWDKWWMYYAGVHYASHSSNDCWTTAVDAYWDPDTQSMMHSLTVATVIEEGCEPTAE